MWKLILLSDLKNLPKYFVLFGLCTYPAIAYVSKKAFGISSSDLLALIFMGYLFFRIFEVYKAGSNLVVPTYIILFGLFTGYRLLSQMFISGYFLERGSKYFLTDQVWLTFIALIVVENIAFSFKTLSLVKKILILTLILASVVSIIQISSPFFLVRDDSIVQGLSPDRLAAYYDARKGVSIDPTGHAYRLLKGYRASIFSYIDNISVGIDTIALFSILFAWKSMNRMNQVVIPLSTALVSFLSSSRFIILNFIVVASQKIWRGKNNLFKLFYFVFLSAILLVIIGLVANFLGVDVNRYITERLMSDSASTRFLALDVFLEVFPDNPLFGTGGVDSQEVSRLLRGRSSQIHVGYLKLFYHYGLIGGVLYLSFMGAFLARLWKKAKYSGYWGGFYAILAFFVANLTLVKFGLFYYGLLLSIIIANHFYNDKLKDQLNDSTPSSFSNV